MSLPKFHYLKKKVCNDTIYNIDESNSVSWMDYQRNGNCIAQETFRLQNLQFEIVFIFKYCIKFTGGILP